MILIGEDKMKMLSFDKKDMDRTNDWLVRWDEYRKEKPFGHPDWTSDAIYQLPLTIALLHSEKTLKRLTVALLFVSVVLAIETLVLIWRTF